ncbi:M15 family metallopeptidase [Pararhizobium sp. LjRoot238]|uniref:M15 family metallopeptidase n=1 Tax=Pararhizobium sp. LjRoot238 TaxID=3342293 RepID=UPI003ECDB162
MSPSIDRASLVFALLLLVAFPAQADELSLARKIKLVIEAYPETLLKSEGGSILFRDGGQALPIDDGKAKDHAQKLAAGDIEDSLSQIYPPGPCETRPEVNFDPGRIRSDALMKRLYGSSAREVEASLVEVEWFGRKLLVTKRQRVARALEKVRDELKTMPDLKVFLTPSAGTFNWRKVAGAPNLSVHSFGAAIDLNTRYADYWIWAGGKPGRVPPYSNKYPMKIVDTFERHGFIWGGRWYHYDTMHFEYRPELIAIAEAAGVSACR